MRTRWIPVMVLVLGLPALAGCKEPEKESEFFGSSVTPMDHLMTDTFVKEVYVDGHWVGSAGTGGSTVAGGIVLPNKWHPGLTARVKWQRCEPYGKNCKWHELNVPVHEYGAVLNTWVHIVDDQNVLVIPSYYPPDGPGYPGPGYSKKNFFDKQQQEAYKKAKEQGGEP
jgi:hypothetical protein